MRSDGATRPHLHGLTTFVHTLYPPPSSLNADEAAFLLEPVQVLVGDDRLDPRLLAAFPDDILLDNAIMDLLDFWGRERHVYLGYAAWPESVVRALAAGLDTRPGLLAFVGSALAVPSTRLEWALVTRPTLVALETSAVPVIEGYAHILQMTLGNPRPEQVDRVFVIGRTDDFPPALLHRLLADDLLNQELRHSIGELVAIRLNKSDDDVGKSFFTVLSTIADQRLAPFRREACWFSLALGEALFRLVGRRGR
jgi:hypothetical protein